MAEPPQGQNHHQNVPWLIWDNAPLTSNVSTTRMLLYALIVYWQQCRDMFKMVTKHGDNWNCETGSGTEKAEEGRE